MLKLRVDVFVTEQNAAYSDIDGKDFKAVHLLGWFVKEDNTRDLCAYSRIFKRGDYFAKNACVGRIVVATQYRSTGIGHHLLDNALDQKYYEGHGFRKVSEQYLEDGIPHIEMLLEEKDLTGKNAAFIGKCRYYTEEEEGEEGETPLPDTSPLVEAAAITTTSE